MKDVCTPVGISRVFIGGRVWPVASEGAGPLAVSSGPKEGEEWLPAATSCLIEVRLAAPPGTTVYLDGAADEDGALEGLLVEEVVGSGGLYVYQDVLPSPYVRVRATAAANGVVTLK